MSDSYKDEKKRQGVDDSVIDYFGPDNVQKRLEDMREAAKRLTHSQAPKSKRGKSPYLDTQLLQQDIVGKYERTHGEVPKDS